MLLKEDKWIELASIMKCPQTDLPIEFVKEGEKSFFKVVGKEIQYPIIDGIPDFVVFTNEKEHSVNQSIEKAYDKSIFMYDDYMSDNKLHWRILKKILLGLNKVDTLESISILRTFLTSVKNGCVLEAAIGTGIFSLDEFTSFSNLNFISIDYSRGMLFEAKKRVERFNIKNVTLMRADVSNLPFKQEVFDAIITLNSIHSFFDKKKALSEMQKVLKTNKKIFGTIILKGERWLTDTMIRLFYEPGKWFMPPALTESDFIDMLKDSGFVEIHNSKRKSLMLFEALNNRGGKEVRI